MNWITKTCFLATPSTPGTPAVTSPKPKNCRCGIERAPSRLAAFNRIMGGTKISPVSTIDFYVYNKRQNTSLTKAICQRP